MKAHGFGLYFASLIALSGPILSFAQSQVGDPRGYGSQGSTDAPVVGEPKGSSIPPAQPASRPRSSSQTSTTNDGSDDDSESPSFVRPQGQPQQLGRYRTASGTVKVPQLLLDAYKDSVVRVTARDEAGNRLNEAMGVAVGVSSEGMNIGSSHYIATSLSLVLGNSVQWADRIEETHDTGSSYSSQVAFIDEQLDLVLLKPKNKPTPIRFVASGQERAQIDVITISFDRDRKNEIVPNFHRGVMAALDTEEGTFTVSGKTMSNEQAGTAVINMNGELMGMLLPNRNGVLSSAITRGIQKIQGKAPFSPRLIGAIMGRGILVDLSAPEAYKTIPEALADLKSGKAPKADPTRYLPAYTDAYKPRAASRTILKIAPGSYDISNTLEIPSNLSIAGSGPGTTILVGKAPDRPIISLDKAKNVAIANLRITPGSAQKALVPTISVRDSENISILGNVIEAKGGRAAIHLQGVKNAGIFGNAFPEGKEKAIYCQTSTLVAQANSFLGKWPQATSIGKGCAATVVSNFFLDNEISVAVSTESKKLELRRNTFLRSLVGARFYGKTNELNVEDNLFYSNRYSLLTSQKFAPFQIGRNAAWKSIAFREREQITGLDFVKGKPEFRNADAFDYRLIPGSPGANSGVPDEDGGSDIGAFQAEAFLGKYTSQFLITLETAVGEKNLAETWGFKLLNAPGILDGPSGGGRVTSSRTPNSVPIQKKGTSFTPTKQSEEPSPDTDTELE
mgnify:CR=1 FL=1